MNFWTDEFGRQWPGHAKSERTRVECGSCPEGLVQHLVKISAVKYDLKSHYYLTVINVRTTNGSDPWTQREIVRGEITDGRGIRRVVMQISFW